MDEPARPDWQRPPFPPGNDAATTHGASSPAKVTPRAKRIAGDAVAAVPYLGTPDFAPALRAWARAEASLELLAEYADSVGLLEDDGTPKPFITTLLRFEAMAAKHRATLGLDPTSRARLERELADAAKGRFDLQAMLKEGREALAARRAT